MKNRPRKVEIKEIKELSLDSRLSLQQSSQSSKKYNYTKSSVKS